MDDATELEKVRSWIEGGRQIGKNLTVDRSGRRFYVRVAVQKQHDKYKVIVDEIDEELMTAEVFEREDDRLFDTLDEAISFIESTTPVRAQELRPSKGQKWF